MKLPDKIYDILKWVQRLLLPAIATLYLALGAIWKEYEEKFKNDGTFDKCDADYFAWMKAQRER